MGQQFIGVGTIDLHRTEVSEARHIDTSLHDTTTTCTLPHPSLINVSSHQISLFICYCGIHSMDNIGETALNCGKLSCSIILWQESGLVT